MDVTSKRGLGAYRALGVPELWRAEEGKLWISVLQDGQYQESSLSPHSPQFSIIDGIFEILHRSQTEGRSQTLQAFRQWLQERSQKVAPSDLGSI